MPVNLKAGRYYTAREIWNYCNRGKPWFVNARSLLNIDPIEINNSFLYTEEHKEKFEKLSNEQRR